MRENKIKKMMKEGKPVINGWLQIPSTVSAEAMAHQGWDSLTIDMQHGLVDYSNALPMLSFKSLDDVIKRANNHELGLCSYVCTNSMETAHLASEQLETGSVAVNTPMVAIAEAPFGGIKQSGYGREGGSMAIKDYLNIKYTHLGIKG